MLPKIANLKSPRVNKYSVQLVVNNDQVKPQNQRKEFKCLVLGNAYHENIEIKSHLKVHDVEQIFSPTR